MMTWAEDRATLGSDPSADPGAKTEGWAAASLCRPPFPYPLRDSPSKVTLCSIRSLCYPHV